MEKFFNIFIIMKCYPISHKNQCRSPPNTFLKGSLFGMYLNVEVEMSPLDQNSASGIIFFKYLVLINNFIELIIFSRG